MVVAFAVACVPPILLLAYIWYIDRLEREPVGHVFAIFLFTAFIGTSNAAFFEQVGEGILGFLRMGEIPYVGEFAYFFLVVAVVEELCKLFPVWWFMWGDKEFDYRFDAVVYSVASAIGFAVAENVAYVLLFGAEVAPVRLIPVHTVCGVMMGYFLSCAAICDRAGNAERRKRYFGLAVLVPVLIHGAWDFCVSVDVVALEVFALVGITVLTVYAWVLVRRLAKFDAPL